MPKQVVLRISSLSIGMIWLVKWIIFDLPITRRQLVSMWLNSSFSYAIPTTSNPWQMSMLLDLVSGHTFLGSLLTTLDSFWKSQLDASAVKPAWTSGFPSALLLSLLQRRSLYLMNVVLVVVRSWPCRTRIYFRFHLTREPSGFWRCSVCGRNPHKHGEFSYNVWDAHRVGTRGPLSQRRSVKFQHLLFWTRQSNSNL